MTLDNTTKIVSIVSVIVGLMISAAGYFANLKLQSLQESVTKLTVAEKAVDVEKKSYDVAARLTTDFSLHLAQSFAIQYSQRDSSEARSHEHILFPTTALSEEFMKMLVKWEDGNGLMTGKACKKNVGLRARQVVTLIVGNIGHADALDIRIKAMEKTSPVGDPAVPWQEKSATQGLLGYYDLLSAMKGWKSVELLIGDLRGLGSPEESRVRDKVVLASVSGSTELYGTILVPIEISWHDNVTKTRQSLPIMQSLAPALRADLLGAEIGTLGDACP